MPLLLVQESKTLLEKSGELQLTRTVAYGSLIGNKHHRPRFFTPPIPVSSFLICINVFAELCVASQELGRNGNGMFLGMYSLTDACLFLRAQSPFARTDDG